MITVIVATRPQPQADTAALEAAEQIDVEVMPARRETVALSASGQGTVSPKREIDLVSQVSGKVDWVAPGIDDGAFFKAGAVLIQIDKRDYEAALSTAKSRVVSAQRVLAEEEGRSRQARREWRDLGSETANALFLRQPQLAAARSELEAARAALQIARVNVERTAITAPFNGRISKLQVDVGQYVTVGTPMAAIYDTSAAEVRIPLTDRQLATLQLPLGRAAEGGPAVTITATVGGRQHEWRGTVTRTDASVDTQSRMYYAIAEISNPFGTEEQAAPVPLMPGLFVTAEIEGRQMQDIIVLPREALVRRHLVYVLDEDNRVRLEEVDVLAKSEASVWLRTEIPDGTLIVLNKHALLSAGIEVEPVPVPAETDLAGGGTE